jgi:hypothetical protein
MATFDLARKAEQLRVLQEADERAWRAGALSQVATDDLARIIHHRPTKAASATS